MSFVNRRNEKSGRPEPGAPRRSGFRLSQGVQMVIAFVVTFLLVMACSLAFVVPALRPEPASAQGGAVPTPDYSQPTAREAYVPALELARESDPQAALMSAAGIWTPPVSMDNLASGRNGWTFFFYLPSNGTMLTVTVGQNSQAEIASVEAWETPPSVFDDDRWHTDSGAAMALLLQECGTTIEETPDAQVELRLSPAQINRTVLWKGLVLSSDSAEPLCEANIDAVTGILR